MTGGDSWYDYIESLVFSKVKTCVTNSVSSTYCTTDGVNLTDTSFPCLYLHELEGADRTNTLKCDTVGAVLCNIQIDIYALTKAQAKKLMRLSVTEMKGMHFLLSAKPVTLQDKDVFHAVGRFRRLFADGDRLTFNY